MYFLFQRILKFINYDKIQTIRFKLTYYYLYRYKMINLTI